MIRSVSPVDSIAAEGLETTQMPQPPIAVIGLETVAATLSLPESAPPLPETASPPTASPQTQDEAPPAQSLALLRANAEQARRVEACLRAFQERLLEQLAQPCFAWDREGRIVRWNEAMTRASGIPAEQALGRTPPQLFSPQAGELLTCAQDALLGRSAGPGGSEDGVILLPEPMTLLPGLTASRLTLLPLYRIPGCLEAVFALIEFCE